MHTTEGANDGPVRDPAAQRLDARARSSSRRAARSTQVGNEEMPNDIRWIRSYVLDEGDGAVGTVCIYQATSPEAIRKHASLADLPVDEIIRGRRHGARAARPAAGRS